MKFIFACVLFALAVSTVYSAVAPFQYKFSGAYAAPNGAAGNYDYTSPYYYGAGYFNGAGYYGNGFYNGAYYAAPGYFAAAA